VCFRRLPAGPDPTTLCFRPFCIGLEEQNSGGGFMANRLTITVFDKGGTDLRDFLQSLSQGLFSADASPLDLLGAEGTASFTTNAGTVQFSIDYVTSGGEVHATGISVTQNGGKEWTASFFDPEPLGFSVWADMVPLNLADGLLGDSRFEIEGRKGAETVAGTEFRDRMILKGGNDRASGEGGNDTITGGKGKDLLLGHDGNDLLTGGKGHDMLIAGLGNDTLAGGAGNDVLVFGAGQQVAKGGIGSDILIFDSFASNAGGSPNVSTVVKTLDPSDVLVFVDFRNPLPVDFEGTTLADVENGTVDDFAWLQTNRGVELRVGKAEVFLKGVTAGEIDLDLLLFTERSAAEAVSLFDSGSQGQQLLGSGLTGDGFVASGNAGTTFTAVGNGSTTFNTYGGDILEFSSTAGGSPNI
ncbi:MAG: calcium-binding protein, partial [Deltaproteobacteria bacterium]